MTKVHSNPTGFDYLPDGVLTRIAVFITRGIHTETALRFAHLSPAAGHAVIEALAYRISYTPEDGSEIFDQVEEWTDIFAQSRREITANLVPVGWSLCNDLNDRLQVPAPALERLVPLLRCVHIPCQPKWLYVLSSAPNLRELYLQVSRPLDHKLLFKTLATLPLTKLGIHCSHRSMIGCIFNDYRLFDPIHDAIMRACPNLAQLSLECRCGCAVWPLLRYNQLSSPCRFIFRCENGVPPEVSRLAELHKSNLTRIRENGHQESDSALTPQLAPSLAELHLLSTQHSFRSNDDLSTLLYFSGLELLSIAIGEDVETGLSHVLRNLPSLHTLYLRWLSVQDDSADGGRRWARASPGALLAAVQSAPNLERLMISEVEISSDEIVSIMESMGPHLKFFGAPTENQKDNPLQRFETYLRTAASFNSGLRDLVNCYFYTPELNQSAVQDRLRALMRQLETAAPFLVHYPYKAFLHEPADSFIV